MVASRTSQSAARRPVTAPATAPTGSATRTAASRARAGRRSAGRYGPTSPRTAAARRARPRQGQPRPGARAFARGEQGGEQAVGAGDSGRQLAEEHQAGIDVAALAVARDEQAAVEWVLAGVGESQDRRVARVPPGAAVDAALLDPAGGVGGGELVWG